MHALITAIDRALYEARRMYHLSTEWGEPIDGENGETFDGAIQRAMLNASSRMDAIEIALHRIAGHGNITAEKAREIAAQAVAKD